MIIKLNGKYVPYFSSGKLNPVLKGVESDNSSPDNKVSLIYYPVLENGSNKLSVIYKTDPDNNPDTVAYDVIVSDELLVNDFYNYPNPMKDETKFIFNLSGFVSQYNFKIKIYTVGGRLIRELDYAANIGNNEIPWDGRDSDGDFIANGTYFYKLISVDGSIPESKVQKLVVLK